MASITKKINQKGEMAFCVQIREKGVQIYKTFFSEEDANLFIFYKSKLLKNKENFDIPMKDRVTLDYCVDLKLREKNLCSKETISFESSRRKFNEKFGKEKFLCQLTYDDWLKAAKEIVSDPVYRGARTEKCKRIMNPSTLRRIFAYASSAISYATSKGIALENHPLKVIQTHITPMIKNLPKFAKDQS
jgi:hypothetical protein